MTTETPDDHAPERPDQTDDVAPVVPPRRTPVFGAPRGVQPDPYPAAARPSFDIPVSAPVSAHPPVVVDRISAPTRPRPDEGAPVGAGVGHPHRRRTDDRTGPEPTAPVGDRRAPTRTSDTLVPDADRAPADRARGRRLRAATIVLSFLLVLALGVGTYLAMLSNEWEQRSSEWEAQSRDLGGEVADLTGDIAGMTSELTLVRDQLATAQTRITELADEKAQVGDDRENQKLLVDDVQEVAETALDVSASLGDCVTAQSAVIGYLAAPDTATPEVLQTAITQADTVCTAAVEDYNSLQQDLAAS